MQKPHLLYLSACRCVAHKPGDRPCARDLVKELTDIELRLRNDMRAGSAEKNTTTTTEPAGKEEAPAHAHPTEAVKTTRDRSQAGQQQGKAAATATPAVPMAAGRVPDVTDVAAAVYTSMAGNKARRGSLDAQMHSRAAAQPPYQSLGTTSMQGVRHSRHSHAAAQARLQPQPSAVRPLHAGDRACNNMSPDLRITASLQQPALGWEPLVLTTAVVQLHNDRQNAAHDQQQRALPLVYMNSRKPAPCTEPSIHTPPMPDNGFVLPRARLPRNEVETDVMQLNALAWPVTLDAEYAEPRSSISL